ncbi:MAG TPA: hypothetical protein VHH73_10855, partial [Verrucomicrobiae bacterium]|nr:hypothetical protein [Verrucomicrobiae bacterium]
VLKAFLLCLFIGGAGLGYVWLKEQNFAFGRQLKEREKRFEKARQQNKDLRDRYATLCTPAVLESQITKWGLGLAMPTPDQIVRLPEPGVGAAPTPSTAATPVLTAPARYVAAGMPASLPVKPVRTFLQTQ